VFDLPRALEAHEIVVKGVLEGLLTHVGAQSRSFIARCTLVRTCKLSRGSTNKHQLLHGGDYSGGVSHSESLCPLCASDMAPFAAHPFMLPPLPSVFPLIAHTLPSVILSRPITFAMATREVETQPQTGTKFLPPPPSFKFLPSALPLNSAPRNGQGRSSAVRGQVPARPLEIQGFETSDGHRRVRGNTARRDCSFAGP